MALSLARWLDPPRRPLSEAVIAAAIVAGLHVLLRMSGVVAIGAFSDDAIYVALGKSIADGTGYHSIYTPGNPVHLKYPPGLPLLVAVLWKLGGSVQAVMLLHGWVTAILMGVTGGLTWWLARRELELSMPIAVPFALGPLFLEGVLQYFHLVLGEPYYLCAWLGSLAIYAALRARRSQPVAPFVAVGLGLVVAVACSFRTQALGLIPAVGLAMMVDRFRARTIAAFAGGSLMPVAVWVVVHRVMIAAGPVSTQPDEAAYSSWLAVGSLGDGVQLASRALTLNWTAYWRVVPGSLAGTHLIGVVIVLILGAALVWGAVSRFRTQPALALTLGTTAVLVGLWPWPQDRLVLSLLPAASLLAGCGIQRALRDAPRTMVMGAVGTLTVIAVTVGTRQFELRRSAFSPRNPQGALGVVSPGYVLLSNTKYVISVSDWVRTHTSPQDRIFAFSPAAIFLYSGRQGVSAVPAESGLAPSLFAVPGRYLAGRVLHDGVTVLIDGSDQVQAELRQLEFACPGSTTLAGTSTGWAAVPAYRITAQESCLREKILK